jgi:transposase
MRKIKEILRLRFECGLTQREIGRAVNVASSTVHDCLTRAKAAELNWPLPEGVGDEELNRRLYVQAERPTGDALVVPDWKQVRSELSQKGVTRLLVWQEYAKQHPDGYSYSRFCELYREWARQLDPTMRHQHKAGERAFVDYAGAKCQYIDEETGEAREASVFVAVLGASSYTYCEAQASEELENWIRGHANAFTYWGGVTEIVVPDNLKTGVKSPCRYEPDLNPTYHEFAKHCGVAVIPARVRKPRDKPKVETAVQVVERWVMAPLRHELFVGLGALNAALRARLDELNDREMAHLGKSRRELFEELDRPALKPLPERPFDMGVWKATKVSIDYHVQFDGHFYSVPYQLIHQTVEVHATLRTVGLYHDGLRVASHRRSGRRGGHSTTPEHMPEKHRKHLEWTPERIVRWARALGPNTGQLIEAVMMAREHPQQGYRSCMGIMRLATKYSDTRLEAAAARTLLYSVLSYQGVKRILESGLDAVAVEAEPEASPLPPHDNVRGSDYYR